MDNFLDVSFFAVLVLCILSIPVLYLFRVFKFTRYFGKKVGPTYWGVYLGQALKDMPGMQQIQIRKASLSEIVTAGSSVYAKGRPVKSLRR